MRQAFDGRTSRSGLYRDAKRRPVDGEVAAPYAALDHLGSHRAAVRSEFAIAIALCRNIFDFGRRNSQRVTLSSSSSSLSAVLMTVGLTGASRAIIISFPSGRGRPGRSSRVDGVALEGGLVGAALHGMWSSPAIKMAPYLYLRPVMVDACDTAKSIVS